MVHVTPGLRLTTREQVRSFAKSRSSLRPLELFAEAHEVYPHPFLARLPDEVPFEVCATRQVVRRANRVASFEIDPSWGDGAAILAAARDTLLSAVGAAPEDYAELLGETVGRVRGVLGRKALRRVDRDVGEETPLWFDESDPELLRALRDALASPADLLRGVTRAVDEKERCWVAVLNALVRYLDTRDEEALEVVRRFLAAWLLLAPAPVPPGLGKRRRDARRLDRLRALEDGSFALLLELHTVVCLGLGEVRRQFLRLFELKLARRAAGAIAKVPGQNGVPDANLRANVIALVNRVTEGALSVGDARVRLGRLCQGFAPTASPEVLMRVRSVAEIFLDKRDVLERLFAGALLGAERVRELYETARTRLPEAFHISWRFETVTTVMHRLWLRPRRDYLDFLKGDVSGDCTSSANALAGEHLRNPRFFNVRLWEDDRRWCGNVYCLHFASVETADGVETVVVDRIQLGREAERLVPESAFPGFVRALAEGVLGAAGVRVLAPVGAISNYSYVRDTVAKRICHGLPVLAFRMPPRESAFESSRVRNFWVLRGAGGPSGAADAPADGGAG